MCSSIRPFFRLNSSQRHSLPLLLPVLAGVWDWRDYPLSAVIMSEYANQKTRGAFIAAVFAMQGVGILVAGAVSMIVSKAFLVTYKAEVYSKNHVLPTQPEGDFVWRVVLMFGAVPAMLTYYWRIG